MSRHSDFATICLPPGGYFVGARDCRMRTMLGAGIVITLWRRAQPAGAMLHLRPVQRGPLPVLELDDRSGEEGLLELLQELQADPGRPDACVARICGTGNVQMQTDRVPSFNSGQRGGELARRLLRAHGIPIVSESFYALGHYEITFDVHTGRIRARGVRGALVAAAAQCQSAAPHPERSNRHRLVTLLR